jgi:hypothetical protein
MQGATVPADPSKTTALLPTANTYDTVTWLRVTIDEVWIGNRIYWTLKQLVTTLYKSLEFSVTVFTALLGNIFQKWTFLCSRAYVLARCVHNTPATAVSRLLTQPDLWSVGQSVLVSSPHLGPMTRFLLLSDSREFVDVGRPLWREDGSVVYNCCWLLSMQSFSGPSPTGLMTIFDCLTFETPPTWRARSPYLYTPGAG